MLVSEAIGLVAKLDRTKKYPTSGAGLQSLAAGLMRAVEITGISGADIVAQCAVLSEWCPTDADLMTVAKDIARGNGVIQGSFDSMAMPSPGSHGCKLCGGSGWEIIYTLHSWEGGNQYTFRKRQNVTEEQAEVLIKKIRDLPREQCTQEVYSGARKCACRTSTAIQA